jgi:hypothetical protein
LGNKLNPKILLKKLTSGRHKVRSSLPTVSYSIPSLSRRLPRPRIDSRLSRSAARTLSSSARPTPTGSTPTFAPPTFRRRSDPVYSAIRLSNFFVTNFAIRYSNFFVTYFATRLSKYFCNLFRNDNAYQVAGNNMTIPWQRRDANPRSSFSNTETLTTKNAFAICYFFPWRRDLVATHPT